MDKAYMLIIAIVALIFIGFISSIKTTTTTKTVVVRDTPPHYYRRYGSNPHYNPYKAQYY
jgi:lipopolysaccharide export system protein LptC